MGSLIDSYDIVVRMNLSCPIPKRLRKDIGSRTDVLYHVLIRAAHTRHNSELFPKHTREQIHTWKNDGVQWVISKLSLSDPRVREFANVINGIIPWVTLPVKSYKFLNSSVGGPPNMGTIAMYHLLQAPIKELTVIGCDFHMNGYYTGYGGFTKKQAELGAGGGSMWGQNYANENVRRVHKLDGQLRFLRQLHRTDPRFNPDEVLLSVLEDTE